MQTLTEYVKCDKMTGTEIPVIFKGGNMKYSRTPATAFSEKNEERIEYLKYFRQQHRMTQSDLAELANTSKRTVEGWESRRKVPAVVTALLARIDELDPNI